MRISEICIRTYIRTTSVTPLPSYRAKFARPHWLDFHPQSERKAGVSWRFIPIDRLMAANPLRPAIAPGDRGGRTAILILITTQ
jgi:hypothetical protein